MADYFVNTYEGKTTLTAYTLKDFVEGVMDLNKKNDLVIDPESAFKVGTQYNVMFIKAKKTSK